MGEGVCGKNQPALNLFGGEEDFLVNHYDPFDRYFGSRP